jgi:hypothetical protein
MWQESLLLMMRAQAVVDEATRIRDQTLEIQALIDRRKSRSVQAASGFRRTVGLRDYSQPDCTD